MTSPTAQTTCTGGKQCTISWQDDGKAPTLAQFGQASIGIWVGSVSSQTEIQHIQDGVNVATTAAVQFTVNPSIGPNSNVYFVRFTSATAKDPANPANPIEAFSAKFTLNGMSGQFNSSIQAQINGASSSGGAVPAPTGTPAPASSSKPTSSASSAPSASKSSTVSAAGAAKTGAASSISVRGSMGALLGAGALFVLAL